MESFFIAEGPTRRLSVDISLEMCCYLGSFDCVSGFRSTIIIGVSRNVFKRYGQETIFILFDCLCFPGMCPGIFHSLYCSFEIINRCWKFLNNVHVLRR